MNSLLKWILSQTLGTKKGADLLNALGPFLSSILDAAKPQFQHQADQALEAAKLTATGLAASAINSVTLLPEQEKKILLAAVAAPILNMKVTL